MQKNMETIIYWVYIGGSDFRVGRLLAAATALDSCNPFTAISDYTYTPRGMPPVIKAGSQGMLRTKKWRFFMLGDRDVCIQALALLRQVRRELDSQNVHVTAWKSRVYMPGLHIMHLHKGIPSFKTPHDV